MHSLILLTPCQVVSVEWCLDGMHAASESNLLGYSTEAVPDISSQGLVLRDLAAAVDLITRLEVFYPLANRLGCLAARSVAKKIRNILYPDPERNHPCSRLF